MTNKHPWELKQEARKSKITKEEFQELIDKAQAREDKFKSDLFKSDKPKTTSKFRMIDGVPHKFKNNTWVPLTKL